MLEDCDYVLTFMLLLSLYISQIVSCIFVDNLARAKDKLKKAEVTSDIQSDLKDSQSKRRRFAPRRLYESDDSDGSNMSDELPRPSLKKLNHS